MKRITGFLFLIFTNTLLFGNDAVLQKRKNYIDSHKADAIRDMLKTGVPASITLAQACLESQDGCSRLAKEANNHFGIKCSEWTGPSFIQDDDKKDECFRKYKTTLESYDDHSAFLRTRSRYSFLFQLELTDYKAWAHGLKKAGYATDPSYASRLIKIIEDNQLYILDQGKEIQYTASIDSKEIDSNSKGPGEYSSRAKKVYVPAVEAVDAFSSRKITTNNGVNCLIVKKGDDFKSLAKEFSLGYWQLPKYNEMKDGADLNEGQIIYLQPKKKEGLVTTYIVKPGDTMLSIAQENGMKLKYIYKYNDLPEGVALEPGQQLVLRELQ